MPKYSVLATAAIESYVQLILFTNDKGRLAPLTLNNEQRRKRQKICSIKLNTIMYYISVRSGVS